MSDLLTETAPLDDPAASESVDSPEVPEVGESVVDASGQDESGTKVIPVERFNGLMSKFNLTQNELAQERAAREAAERRYQELETQLVSTPEPEAHVSDISALEERVSVLTDLLMSRESESVKAAALEKYPEAKAFADIIVADTPEGYEEMAKTIADRVKGTAPAPQAEVETPSETPLPAAVAETAPVTGGGSGAVGTGTVGAEDLRREAIQKRDLTAWLRAAKEDSVTDGLVLES